MLVLGRTGFFSKFAARRSRRISQFAFELADSRRYWEIFKHVIIRDQSPSAKAPHTQATEPPALTSAKLHRFRTRSRMIDHQRRSQDPSSAPTAPQNAIAALYQTAKSGTVSLRQPNASAAAPSGVAVG